MTCCSCQKPAKSERLPRGWKRLDASVYCESCWKQRYVVRSVVMPVAEPVGEAWQDFKEVLKEGWVQATSAANWMMTEFYSRDFRRKHEDKMPPMARIYLYPEARQRFPQLAPQTVVSIEQRAQAAYRAARYEVIWTSTASLPTFRFPMPLPVHNQSWEPTIQQERPVVRVRLGDRWWNLRLKGGPRFRRQTAQYRQIVSGQAIRGELALYRLRAHDGEFTDRPNSDQTVRYTVMCKLVAWFPREKPEDRGRSESRLQVQTAGDMLLVALNARGEIIWQYHGDHLRRWSAQYRRLLVNLADDQKAEQRPVPSFADRRTAASLKFRNRMRSAIREIAAQLVGYVARCGHSVVEYNDSIRAFCPEFQYAALRERIRDVCHAAGLDFRHENRERAPQVAANHRPPQLEPVNSGPPAGPARATPDTLADLPTRGRL
jgi:hypothetical protein